MLCLPLGGAQVQTKIVSGRLCTPSVAFLLAGVEGIQLLGGEGLQIFVSCWGNLWRSFELLEFREYRIGFAAFPWVGSALCLCVVEKFKQDAN
jgi:hypothetical protein